MNRMLLFVVLIAGPAAPSDAMQLRWSTGGTSLTFSEGVRCSLIVDRGPGGGSLPSELHLVWLAVGTSLSPIVQPSGGVGIADVCDLDRLQTSAQVDGHEVSARLCSSGEASLVRYIFDLPAESRGKIRVVALDPADPDSGRVLSSEAVTFNGGVSGDFPPVICRTLRQHPTSQLLIKVSGASLSTASVARNVAQDRSWSIPLDIVSKSDTTLELTTEVGAALPTSAIVLTTSSGTSGMRELQRDDPVAPAGAPPQAIYHDVSGYIRPKDFAFFYDYRGHWHLIYIRHNNFQSIDDLNETKFCHVWSNDLANWTASANFSVLQDTTSFQKGPSGSWDALHVWAPSLLQVGGTTYMFYTGVDGSHNESIGYASTSNLTQTNVVWNRQSSPMFTNNEATWVAPTGNSAWGPGRHLRDPFVMEDPLHPGYYLMYYCAVRAANTEQMCVGVARSAFQDPTHWTDIGPLLVTSATFTFDQKVESPHAFDHVNTFTTTWGTNSAYLFYTEGRSPNSISFYTHRDSVTDVGTTFTPGTWNKFARLYAYTKNDTAVADWNATEYLRVWDREYLAGYNSGRRTNPDSNGVWFRQVTWTAATAMGEDSLLVAPASVADVDGAKDTPTSLDIRLVSSNPGRRHASFELDVPEVDWVAVRVYDVAGRQVCEVLNDRLQPGRRIVHWSGRTSGGTPVPSGVYFLRANMRHATRTLRFVHLD